MRLEEQAGRAARAALAKTGPKGKGKPSISVRGSLLQAIEEENHGEETTERDLPGQEPPWQATSEEQP